MTLKRRRRCRYCRELFNPDHRVGDRQKTCSTPDCQRMRKLQNCRDWRAREAPVIKRERLARRLAPQKGTLNLKVVRDEWGWKTEVLIRELSILTDRSRRDEYIGIELGKQRLSLILSGRVARDESVGFRVPP